MSSQVRSLRLGGGRIYGHSKEPYGMRSHLHTWFSMQAAAQPSWKQRVDASSGAGALLVFRFFDFVGGSTKTGFFSKCSKIDMLQILLGWEPLAFQQVSSRWAIS